jgi:Cys-tRNA(Pro)/Cys-tRNA(Cys) deacylase
MGNKQTGGTPATVALTRAGVAFTLHPYEHRADAASYGQEAVEALGSDPRRVLKTLVTEVSGCAGTELVVAVVPVSQHVDLKALAFPTVLVSAGKRGLQVELAPADLVRATAALVATVAA